MTTTPNVYDGKSDALLRHLLADAQRRARTARGPSAAQNAVQTATRITAELKARKEAS